MNYHLLVQKNSMWQELDLPNDFNLSLVINSGFLGTKQSGSFSFSSQLPTTANNCEILQNAQNPQIIMDRRIELPAVLMYGSSEIYTWYFILRNVSDTQYRYDLRQTPGNQPRKFFDLKLWQMDFGRLDLQSVNKKSGIFSVNLYGNTQVRKLLITDEPVLFEIWVNGQLIARPPFNGKFVDAKWYWIKQMNDAETRFALATANTNFRIILHEQNKGIGTLNITALNNIPIISASLRIYKSRLIFSTQNFNVERGDIIGYFDLQECVYQDVTAYLNQITSHPSQYPFKFIQYNSDAYYPSDNKQYEGIVNQYGAFDNSDPDNPPTNKILLLNGNLNYNTYPISPCFSLGWILEKVATMMGFELVSDVFQDKIKSEDNYLGALYLLNNCDLSEQLVGTTIPYNVYGKTINYNYFMPDMTVKEFIDAIRSLCLSVEYDYQEGKILVGLCKETLLSKDVIDISDKISRVPECQVLDKTYYQLSFKNGDEKIISQFSYPTDASILDDGRAYTKIEVGFTPALNNFDIDPFLITDYNPGTPTASESARTNIYLDQKGNHPTQKMCFFLGFDGLGKTIADNKNNNICLSFANNGTLRGLVDAFYREYLDFLNQTFQWTADITLSEIELANFKFAQKYWAYGTVFIPETISPKLPIKDKMKISLLSM